MSLVKNSEVTGFKVFGPENIAMVKIRLITLLISRLLIAFAVGNFCTMPGIFWLFYGDENKSNFEHILNNKFRFLFFVNPILAFAINLLTTIYSYRINRQMEQSPSVFILFGTPSRNNTTHFDKFSFSLGFVIFIPFLSILSFFTKIFIRKYRILIFCPLQIVLLNVAMPIVYIYKKPKIKKKLYEENLYPIICKLKSMLSIINKPFSRKVIPVENFNLSKI